MSEAIKFTCAKCRQPYEATPDMARQRVACSCGHRMAIPEPLSRLYASQALPPGTLLTGQYRIESLLGQGGFGVTYLATDINLELTVAIKEYLPSELAVRDNTRSVRPKSVHQETLYDHFRERFLDEARTLAHFQHPNVVRILNYFEANNTAYLVMDFVSGNTLKKEVKRAGGFLDERHITRFLPPLLHGLDKLHGRGLIHRDIKPDNIIIRDDGQPVLIDFGAARQYAGAATQTLTAILTPGFAPMEQYYTDSRQQGAWTDIYAISAVIYYCLTGKPPVEATIRLGLTSGGEPDPLEPIDQASQTPCSTGMVEAVTRGLAILGENRPDTITRWSQPLKPAGVIARPASRKKPIRPCSLLLQIVLLMVLCTAWLAGTFDPDVREGEKAAPGISVAGYVKAHIAQAHLP